jgi:hypothetical protein
MNTLKTFRTSLLLAVFSTVMSSLGAGIPLGTNAVIEFAGPETGRTLLTNRDEFIAALSPFDRRARKKSSQEVAEKEFVEFVGKSVLPWSAAETNAIGASLASMVPRVAPWNLPLPPKIWLIKTTGQEEGDACYTRANAIILPEREVRSAGPGLEGIILHELFHVLSRHNPKMREQLYHIIGFRRVNEIELPPALKDRKITNPDGVQNGWSITVTNQNKELPAVPILYASTEHYDVQKGGEFFNYLVFKLLVIESEQGRFRPKMVGKEPELLDPSEAGGFRDQIGQNTGYIIHPDEILADNFEQLMRGTTNQRTPRITEEMKKVFDRH